MTVSPPSFAKTVEPLSKAPLLVPSEISLLQAVGNRIKGDDKIGTEATWPFRCFTSSKVTVGGSI